MAREKRHQAYNVYGDGNIETVENAVGFVMEDTDADTVSEALAEIASSYTGYDRR